MIEIDGPPSFRFFYRTPDGQMRSKEYDNYTGGTEQLIDLKRQHADGYMLVWRLRPVTELWRGLVKTRWRCAFIPAGSVLVEDDGIVETTQASDGVALNSMAHPDAASRLRDALEGRYRWGARDGDVPVDRYLHRLRDDEKALVNDLLVEFEGLRVINATLQQVIDNAPQLSETKPPPAFADREFHWLKAELSSRPVPAQWLKGNWYPCGEDGGVTPAEMWSSGWRWAAVAKAPGDEESGE